MPKDQPDISILSLIYGCSNYLKKLVAQVHDSFEGRVFAEVRQRPQFEYMLSIVHIASEQIIEKTS